MRPILLALMPFLLLGCGTGPAGHASGPPRREYRVPPAQARAAVLDTLDAMGMPVESQRSGSVIVTEWTEIGSPYERERARLRVEIRGGGEHSVVTAEASHMIQVRKGLRSDWEDHPTYGRLEQRFLSRLDTRLGVVK